MRTLILANFFMHCIIKFLGIGFSLILNNVKNSKVKTQKWKKDSIKLIAINLGFV